jgi:hypothetical protein
MAFVVKSKDSGDDIELEMQGALEEGAQLPALKPRLAKRVVIDFEHVDKINPEGLRLLSIWFRGFDQRQQFVFRRVPQRVVDIFNQVRELLPLEHIIESFYVPYQCATCEHTEEWLARRGKDYVEAADGRPLKLNLPTTINCSTCKNLMKIEVWESKYFRFLESQK